MRKTAVLLAAALFSAGCSTGESAQITPVPSPSGSGSDAEVCQLLESESPPAEFVDVVPEEHREAAQALVDLGVALDGMFDLSFDIEGESSEESVATDPAYEAAIESLTAPGVSDRFAAMADDLEDECGPSTGVDGIRSLAVATALAEPDADEEYCPALAAFLDAEADTEMADEQIDELIALAPESHVEPLEELRSLIDGGFPTEDAAPSELAGVLSGLGLYAEAKCDVEGAFALMLFAGAFAGMATADPGETGGADPVGDPSDDPPEADVTAANAAVPSGSDLTWEVGTVALTEDGDFLASLVVPAGWQRSDFSLGAGYEPSEDEMGFFTDMSYDTGCDGVCQRTDWSARLNGTDGYLTRWVEDRELTVNREIDGSAGVVLVGPSNLGGVDGLIARWDDGADRYFTCQFMLDEEDVALADSFTAACEAARPGWFPVA